MNSKIKTNIHSSQSSCAGTKIQQFFEITKIINIFVAKYQDYYCARAQDIYSTWYIVNYKYRWKESE